MSLIDTGNDPHLSMEQEVQRIRVEYARRDSSELSRIYSYSNPAFVFHMQEREWAILRLLRSEHLGLSGFSVLEVGCGTGHILQRFMDFGVTKAMGIDLMESRIEIGKRAYPHLHLVQGNAAKLPFTNGSFDLVMQFMCLSSVLDPEMRQQIAAEMWRVTRPGGAILSYDLRPLPIAVRLFNLPYYMLRRTVRVFINRSSASPKAAKDLSPPTPTKPLRIEELKRFYNKGLVKYRSVSLNFNLSQIAVKSFFLATLVSYVPFLRTHFLVFIRKPS